jgi:hypothetical protein
MPSKRKKITNPKSKLLAFRCSPLMADYIHQQGGSKFLRELVEQRQVPSTVTPQLISSRFNRPSVFSRRMLAHCAKLVCIYAEEMRDNPPERLLFLDCAVIEVLDALEADARSLLDSAL